MSTCSHPSAQRRAAGTPAEGERVRVGDPLMAGPSDPHGIVMSSSTRNRRRTGVSVVQEVSTSQGANINDKHIEVINRQ